MTPKSLTIAKGGSGTVSVTKGATPYTASADKTSITTSVNEGTVTISVGATSTASSGIVTIKDGNGSKEKVAITITEE